MVGTSSYLEVSAGEARLEVGATGYSPAVWGSAVNPASKQLLLGLAFEGLHVGPVRLRTDVGNTRSQRAGVRRGLLARLGARR